jgi:hypothetical protein
MFWLKFITMRYNLSNSFEQENQAEAHFKNKSFSTFSNIKMFHWMVMTSSILFFGMAKLWLYENEWRNKKIAFPSYYTYFFYGKKLTFDMFYDS